MIRTSFIPAALLLPAAAFAQTHEPAGHGATAGRSPHAAYRPVAADAGCKTMHSLPGGKLPVYGSHAHPAKCATPQIASAGGASKLAHAE
ncbi:hypothetical protein [Sphingomonas oryzagri]